MSERLEKDPQYAAAIGLDELETLALAVDGLQAEWDLSWSGFSQEKGTYQSAKARGSAACGRFREWFLLEHHSPTLMGTPFDKLIGAWREARKGLEEHSEPLLQASFTGIFEVSQILPDQGAWMRDISGFGEYALTDPRSSSQLEIGDLLVGRLFPLPSSIHMASGQAVWFRSAELSKALERDLGQAREGRRSIIRLGAPQLELMFFASELPNAAPKPKVVDPDKALADAREFLIEAGLPRIQVDQALTDLELNPMRSDQILATPNDPVGIWLERLAFETEVDLTKARALMTVAWQALSIRALSGKDKAQPATAAGLAPAKTPGNAPATAPKDKRKSPQSKPTSRREVIERFFASRAAGGDLEQQFADLEKDLGLLPGTIEEEDQPAPDFPGVVGAMVEEFLWDAGRQGNPIEREALEPFIEFTKSIGLFEDLGRRDILSFATFWLLERRVLETAEQASKTIHALQSFCRWAEEEHSLELHSEMESTLEGLRSNLPRIAVLNQKLAGLPAAQNKTTDPTFNASTDEDPGTLFALKQISNPDRCSLIDRAGNAYTTRLPDALCEALQPGDHLRAHIDIEGNAQVLCIYPPEARELYQ